MILLGGPPVYTLKITLIGTEPPVWRRVVVRSDIGLGDLHDVIQLSMGWEDHHLHHFIVGKSFYGVPEPNQDDFGFKTLDEQDFALIDIAPRKGSKFKYEYDFGDSWQHEIRVEKIERDVPGHTHPVCLDGERNCPPEDVGGIWGYSELVEAMADRKHKRRKEFIEWLGEPFNPEAIDLKEANKQLKKLRYR